MAADALAALGLELRAEADAWLAALTPDTLPDGTLAARELFQAFGALEAEVADAAADEVELTRLQAWLTSGFFAPPEPYAPADAVVAEVMDEARRRGADSEAESADRGASPASGADESAAGRSQSPPARTAAAGPLPRPGGVADPPAQADARRVVDSADSGRDGGSAAPAASRRDGWSAASADPQRARGDDSRPAGDRRVVDGGGGSAAGGIQGLAALAAFAGSGGIEIPAPREDADHHPQAPEQPHGTADRAAREPEAGRGGWPAHPVDVDRADAAPSPSSRSSAEVRQSTSANRSVDVSPAREMDQREGDAVRLPPRIIRVPFTAQSAERMVDADEGWIAAAPLPIPFLTPPGEAEPHDTRAESTVSLPAADARRPLALPSMRVFDGAGTELPAAGVMPTPDARRAIESEWAGFGEPAESSEAFLARAARVAGQRLRPAAKIVGGDVDSVAQMPSVARTSPSAPAESRADTRLSSSGDAVTAAYPIVPSTATPSAYPIVSAAAEPDAYPIVQSAAEPDAYPTVWTREVAAPRPVEGMEWPAPDVTDLLDALASEIAHEYRRYYGE